MSLGVGQAISSGVAGGLSVGISAPLVGVLWGAAEELVGPSSPNVSSVGEIIGNVAAFAVITSIYGAILGVAIGCVIGAPILYVGSRMEKLRVPFILCCSGLAGGMVGLAVTGFRHSAEAIVFGALVGAIAGYVSLANLRDSNAL
jgi:hypothetical protein